MLIPQSHRTGQPNRPDLLLGIHFSTFMHNFHEFVMDFRINELTLPEVASDDGYIVVDTGIQLIYRFA